MMHFPSDLNLFSLVVIDDLRCKVKDPSLLRYAQEKLAIYADTYGEFYATAESDLTLQVLRDLEQMAGREITWVRGKSFDEVLNGTQTRLPSWARRYCTMQMKIEVAAQYIYLTLPEGIHITNIGLRADEISRIDRLRNNPDAGKMEMPISCNIATHRQKWIRGYKYRSLDFPLATERVFKRDIKSYWAGRSLVFPPVSNCVGCFHKAEVVINRQFQLEPEKMNWFAEQEEQRNMGTWHDSLRSYRTIANTHYTGNLPLDHELYGSCSTDGCTD